MLLLVVGLAGCDEVTSQTQRYIEMRCVKAGGWYYWDSGTNHMDGGPSHLSIAQRCVKPIPGWLGDTMSVKP